MRERRERSALNRRAGFTLIEIIAVVAIIALVMGLGLPRLGRSTWDPLEHEAENLAQRLRFARQRAIMTGQPHRLLIDLEEGGYRVEWYTTEAGALGQTDEALTDLFSALLDGTNAMPDGRDEGLTDFTPRRDSEREYLPIPHREMGSFRWLDDALYFVGVEGATGWVESGDYSIVFYEDGTTDPALLELADSDDNHLTLEIEPILERVRVREGGTRS